MNKTEKKIRKITPYTAKVILNKVIKKYGSNDYYNQKIENLRDFEKQYRKLHKKKLRDYKSKAWRTRIKRERAFLEDLAFKEINNLFGFEAARDFFVGKGIKRVISKYETIVNQIEETSIKGFEWTSGFDNIDYLRSFCGDYFMDIDSIGKIRARDKIISENWNSIQDFERDYEAFYDLVKKGIIPIKK